MSDVPQHPAEITQVTYCLSLLTTDPDIETLRRETDEYVSTLNTWLTDRKLILSPEKSATLFPSWTKEISSVLDIQIYGRTILQILSLSLNAIHLNTQYNYKYLPQ